ncbi:ROK family protein [Pseudoflavitalea sp. G-6-1-2]|uniref:ROK family protein n=1 Tax=Pseudoflavitalea sp. G-6-1-2 TaxID=2728841 RepID=UPI00146F0809|nr:ROK family protein [Pseudoflavitalea sp. G-6-1-2]NML21609.1 ROK family protein [Pseudoflavitalea sp. G-6-1-2]
MSLIGMDLGGTKLAIAAFTADADMTAHESVPLERRTGAAVAALMVQQLEKFLRLQKGKNDPVRAIGICVPGISNRKDGTVWAPNIPGWGHYPLLKEISAVAPGIPVAIDSDRTCYIMGEVWKGAARGCSDAIFLGVGTGIGAGILSDGHFLRGRHDAAGAIGWMALTQPYHSKYLQCGCFESSASGDGIAKLAKELLHEMPAYEGVLRRSTPAELTAAAVFAAFETRDELATEVIRRCIELWGMAVANLVSVFNPEKIIMGGGVFGPAIPLIPSIAAEAAKWAQPLSMQQCEIVASQLGIYAGCWGAGLLALKAR